MLAMGKSRNGSRLRRRRASTAAPGTAADQHDDLGRRLMQIHDTLLAAYGPQKWWPAQTASEMIIGAILVQHSSWRQVETAIAALARCGLLDFAALARTTEERLAGLIRPSGTPRVKARRLLEFAGWLGDRYRFDLTALLAR